MNLRIIKAGSRQDAERARLPTLSASEHALRLQLERETREANTVLPGSLAGELVESSGRTVPASSLEIQRAKASRTRQSLATALDAPLRKYSLSEGPVIRPLPIEEQPVEPIRLFKTTMVGHLQAKLDIRHDGVSSKQITKAYEGALDARREWLKDLDSAPKGDALSTEDFSMQPCEYLMAGTGSLASAFAEQMSQIGAAEGFKVTFTTSVDLRNNLLLAAADTLSVERVNKDVDSWTQDHGEATLNGGFTIPAPGGGFTFLSNAIDDGRVERMPADLARSFITQGMVDSRKSQKQVIGHALASGAPVRANLTYLEGGNVLVGVLPSGKGYALVGEDSVAVSKAVLEHDLYAVKKHHVVLSREQVLEAISKDLGVERENLFAVEQPGEFHLDMGMTLLGPGVVLVNDSMKANALEAQWLEADHEVAKPVLPHGASSEETKRYVAELKDWEAEGEKNAEKVEKLRSERSPRAELEDLTTKSLEGSGLTVHRVAAAFNFEGRAMNFLNGVKGTNPQGKRFCISLGGDPRAERHFMEEMKRIDS
jgi:hypothetical protein